MVYFLAIALGVALDRIVKMWTIFELKPVSDIPLIEGIFHLTYEENTGAAYGMMSDYPILLIVAPLVSIIALSVLLALKKFDHPLGEWATTLVVSGAIGNLIDRWVLGYVVDLFYVKVINFAVFNVADIFVTVGGALFVLYIFLFYGKKKPISEQIAKNSQQKPLDTKIFSKEDETL